MMKWMDDIKVAYKILLLVAIAVVGMAAKCEEGLEGPLRYRGRDHSPLR
ncbi:MAG: hypothetical protein IKH16_02240 [Selenomonadaceae bacterium]|nr:hypothetical protein [Selenomonadaceae bacterium]MBR4695182.1 hypothetical protein [Selenomonadaceae bacterium]